MTHQAAPAALGENVLRYAPEGPVELTTPQRNEILRSLEALRARLAVVADVAAVGRTTGMKFRVYAFAEGDFERAFEFDSRMAAENFRRGASFGAGLYGAGTLGFYLLPDEEAEMREAEDADEIARAILASVTKIVVAAAK